MQSAETQTRRSYRRKRTFHKRPKASLLKGMMSVPRVHRFKRVQDATLQVIDNSSSITNSSGTKDNGYFSLDQLPNYSEFSNLFDAYRIIRVKQTFIYSANSVSQSDTSPPLPVNVLPCIVSVLDYDDGTALSTMADYEQYRTFKYKRLDKIFVRTFRPRVAQAVYEGAFTGYGEANKNQWLDCSDGGIQHYGHKWGVDRITGSSTNDMLGYLRVITEYIIEFKDSR